MPHLMQAYLMLKFNFVMYAGYLNTLDEARQFYRKVQKNLQKSNLKSI